MSAAARQGRLAFGRQRLHREAAGHLGEERVHALLAGRAAADGGAEAGGPRVAAGDRQQSGGFAPGVVERIEVEAAVAAEHLVHLHEAPGVARAQAEDHLGRRLVDRVHRHRFVRDGRFALGAFLDRRHAVAELEVGLGLQEHILLG